MPRVLLAKDDEKYQARLAELREKRRADNKLRDMIQNIRNKKFSELSPSEKDELLKVVALRLNLIKPD